MNGHPDLWLDAFLDGELEPARRREVEAHLAACPDCRGRVDGRRELSAWLRSDPEASQVRTDQRFVAEVILRLPRAAPRSLPPVRWGALLGWAVPLMLIPAWAFVRAVDLVGGAIEWIPGVREWVAARAALLPGMEWPFEVRWAAAYWNGTGLAGWDLSTGWVLWTAISLVYIGWLTAWWLANGPAAGKTIMEKET